MVARKNQKWIVVLGLSVVFGWLWLKPDVVIATRTNKIQRSEVPPTLTVGEVLARELKGGEKHAFSLTLKPNDFLKLVVEQKGIDVLVRLVGPDGKKLVEVDSPNGTQGPEPLFFLVEQAGSYIIEIESLVKNAPPGKYEVRLEALRPATEQDRAQIEIEKLNAEGRKLRQSGKYDAALPLAEKALEKSEKLFGPEHLLVGDCLINLAELHRLKGDYSKAEALALRSLFLYEKVLGPDHLDVASILNGLALVLREKGDYVKAESLYLRALGIREKFLGADHPDIAGSLNQLALLYKEMGDYTKAEQLYQRSLAIREKVLGPESPDVARSLNNLAGLYYLKGDFDKAEKLYQRSLPIYEKVQGPDHPNFATALSNLALVYDSQGNTDQAIPLLQRALKIRETVLGPDHLDVANSLNNLAVLYWIKGDSAQAEAMYQRSLALWEKKLGPDHPFVAQNLNNLALLYQARGDYAQAETLFQRALAIREKTLTVEHPYIAASLNNLALLYQAKGDVSKAVAYQIRANEANEHNWQRNLMTGSERQKLLYLEQTAKYFDATLSFDVPAGVKNQDARSAALTLILQRKGRGLDAMAQSIEALRQRALPDDQRLFDELKQIKGNLSTLILKGPGSKGIEHHRAEIKELEAKTDELEAQISARSATYRTQFQPITLEAIQKAIPPDAVLVELAAYRSYDDQKRKWGARRYAAYLLFGSKSRILNPKPEPSRATPSFPEIQCVDLGEAEPIEKAVTAFRQALSSDSLNLAKEIQPLAQTLNQLVMKPVCALAGNTSHLLLSPDGILNLIPFSALMDEKGNFLVENYTFTYLTSGRDLLRLQVKIDSHEPPFILADPDYKIGSGPFVVGSRLSPLRRLLSTAKEGTLIQKIFHDSTLKMRTEATENAVKSLHHPEILHIATHGCFLQDVTPSTKNDQQRLGNLEPSKGENIELLRQANPLLRSYLFFAGANRGGSEDNDGIMTALEAANLDLWGTKLVVLSACDTGLGDVKNGDGVYGLRRALVLAGSETQMISLWSVPDLGTQELMVEYYTRLKNGEGRSEALRNVQLTMLKDPKWRHPYFWAGFIQSGEWADLNGQRK